MPRVKKSSASNWRHYLLKAKEFLVTAQDSYAKENWNAVGLNAVHSAISANDALTVYLAGTRSASKQHIDAVSLLLKEMGASKEAFKTLASFN